MTSILPQGKYRQRRDWSTNSIPELVSLEEEQQSSPMSESPPPLPPKPRRSSLAIGLLGGRGLTDKNYKRRSSIAVTFLGRQNKVMMKHTQHYFSCFPFYSSSIPCTFQIRPINTFYFLFVNPCDIPNPFPFWFIHPPSPLMCSLRHRHTHIHIFSVIDILFHFIFIFHFILFYFISIPNLCVIVVFGRPTLLCLLDPK